MNQLIFARRVIAQITQAYTWYEAQQPHLGEEFVEELERTLSALRDSPQRYPLAHNRTRRARLRRFPYMVYYRIASKRVVVVSIFHEKRKPRHW